jgi:hypothetical protein
LFYYFTTFSENLCISNGGTLKKSDATGKIFCWREGWFTRPQADNFCKRVCGRLPVIHNYIDNQDVGNVAASVSSTLQILPLTFI